MGEPATGRNWSALVVMHRSAALGGAPWASNVDCVRVVSQPTHTTVVSALQKVDWPPSGQIGAHDGLQYHHHEGSCVQPTISPPANRPSDHETAGTGDPTGRPARSPIHGARGRCRSHRVIRWVDADQRDADAQRGPRSSGRGARTTDALSDPGAVWSTRRGSSFCPRGGWILPDAEQR